MKTAMQQLLQIVNNDIKNAHILKNNGLNNVDDINTLISTYNYFKIIIERDMIEREKEQIMQAYSIGFLVSKNLDMPEASSYVKNDYYNQAHNQNN